MEDVRGCRGAAGRLALEGRRRPGPDGITLDQAETRAAVGVGLLRLAELPDALAILRPVTTGRTGPGNPTLRRQIGDLVDDLDRLVGATADDLPGIVAALRTRSRAALSLAAANRVDEASTLLDDRHGMALWIRCRHPYDDEALCLQADIARHLGATALRCGREAAARRGLDHALAGYRIAVTERQHSSCVESWLDTHLLSASLLAASRDLVEMYAVLGDLRVNAVRWSPLTAADWERADRLSAQVPGDAPS